MRRIFSYHITRLAQLDKSVILIVGDIGYGLFGGFASSQILNIGICEQSMISVAAGMTLEGLKPWVYTITPFLIERPFEQIKLDIDQQKANVKLVGYADYPDQGPTHAEIDAPKLMGLFRNIRSYFPKTNEEVREAMIEALKPGPVFISLKKARE